jgi:hypothetical protein
MTLRWSVSDSVFKLENEFHKEALLVIASLKPPKVSNELQESLDRILELSDLLSREWQKAHPVVNQKELSHLAIQTVISEPIRN